MYRAVRRSISPPRRCGAVSGCKPVPCFRPIQAFQQDDGSIVFREQAGVRRPLSLPCGKCVGCLLERSRQWAVRIMHEAQMHEMSSFVTLTYDDENLPPDGGLKYSDFQLFVERVRRRWPKARFFMCGEYGSVTFRPHYHACLFGVHFADRQLFSKSGAGSNLYVSESLSALWPLGHASVGDLTFESAAYVARYVTKKLNKDDDDRLLRFDEYGVCYWLAPEFSRMSLRPGIGANWFKTFGKEVLARGNVVMRGVEMKVPRYYAKLCSDPAFDWIEFENQKNFNPLEATDDRLAVREHVAEARLALKKRSLE